MRECTFNIKRPGNLNKCEFLTEINSPTLEKVQYHGESVPAELDQVRKSLVISLSRLGP
jgi:hypothetical protein